jgi:23S rRNA pseudouridine1911/1915/1917 synthase
MRSAMIFLMQKPDRHRRPPPQGNRSAPPRAPSRPAPARSGGRWKVDVLWEDDRLIAVEKPEGLAVIAPEGSREKTLLSIVSAVIGRGNSKVRAAVVHRIDRDTSGVVLFAKDGRGKAALMGAWNELVLERRYSVLVEGAMEARAGRFVSFIKEESPGRVRVTGRGDRRGLEAITDWELVSSGPKHDLVDALLSTGRRHQIRIQFSEAGHPVAGDARYGARTNPLGRLCLHAGLLVFRHPFTGETVRVESPAPPEFSRLARNK